MTELSPFHAWSQASPYALALGLAALMCAALAVAGWRRRAEAGGREFALMMAVAASWALFYSFELSALSLTGKAFWARLEYVSTLLPFAWFLFARAYSGATARITARHCALIGFIPGLTVVLVATNGLHRLVWKSVYITAGTLFPDLVEVSGPWFWVQLIYAYGLLLLGSVLFIRTLGREKRRQRQAGIVMAAVAVPWIGNALYVFVLQPIGFMDVTPFVFVLTGGAFLLAMSRLRLFSWLPSLLPAARSQILQKMKDGVLVLDAEGRVALFNPAATNLLRHRCSNLAGKTPQEIFGDALPAGFRVNGHEAQFELSLNGGDKRSYFDVLSSSFGLRKGAKGRLLVLRDISERRRAEEALRESEVRFRALIENSSDLIAVLDDKGVIQFQSPSSARVLGYAPEELEGEQVFKHLHPSDVKRSEVDLAKLMRGESGSLVRAETRFRHKDGSWRTLEVMGTRFLDSAGDVTCVLNSRDVTEQRLWEETLRHQALHDGITGLPNRACLRDRLQTLMHAGRRKPKPFALYILDLDSFKEMNDTFGHHCGDDILRQVAYRLQKHIRSADVVARMGGDEFALAVCLDSREDAAAVGGRILDALGPGYEVEGHKLSLSASVGAALFPEHAVGPDNLLRLADMAMYTAKRGGGGRFAIYDIERDSHSRDRIALQGELRDAFEREELRLHFQPFFDSTGKRVLGVEALARWQHPRRGLIMPGDFLETLGQDGLSRAFTAWVLKSALSQCAAWHEEGLNVDMAINLSARDLDDNQLPRLISKLLAENHIDPRRLTVELTEDTVMLEPERSRATLGALREIGVGVALDDFGCGHATFTWLRTLPFSRMKIDRSFVLNMAVQKEDAAIVRSAIGLGHDLGLTVVGEGVENLATMRLLKAFGCDILQGNYLGRPMPGKSAARHIARFARDGERETDEPESVLPGALLGAVPRSLPS